MQKSYIKPTIYFYKYIETQSTKYKEMWWKYGMKSQFVRDLFHIKPGEESNQKSNLSKIRVINPEYKSTFNNNIKSYDHYSMHYFLKLA